MNIRLKKLRLLLKKNNIDGILIAKNINISYLIDFPASESWLFVTIKSVYYITDFRYIEEARKGLSSNIKLIQFSKSHYDELFKLIEKYKLKRIGFDENETSVTQHKRLNKFCFKGVKMVAANGFVEILREIKDTHEINQIKKALKIHHKALLYLKRIIKSGITEKEVFLKLEKFVKLKDADFSFDPIIASGANSALPHAHVTNRKFQTNEIVLLDMGIDYKGYKSDLTRIFFLGRISQSIREVYDSVDRAKKEAIKYIRAGVSCRKIDEIARKVLKENNLDKYFGHSLGHGVGLEIHESPRLSQKSPDILKEGMVVTVEPGVYLEGNFGVRLEEMVLVTKKGCKVLSDNIN